MPHTPPSSDESLPPDVRDALDRASHMAGAFRSSVDVDAAYERHLARWHATHGDTQYAGTNGLSASESALSVTSRSRSPRHAPAGIAARTPLARWSVIAATVAAAAGLMFVVTPTTTPRGGRVNSQTYTTRTGERATITLPDGSHATLAPRTTAVVSGSRDGLTVSVVGEALFDVAPNAHTPFLVRTGNVTARVLGTRFDVRRYQDDRAGRIVVQSGRVSVTRVSSGMPESTGHDAVTLSAGMMTRFTDTELASAAVVADSSAYTNWTRGVLDFTNTPVPDVLSEMGRWYGYRFQLADTTLMHRRLTATFDYQSRADLFQALETLLSVSVTLDHTGTDTVVVLRWHPRSHSAGILRRSPVTPLSNSSEVGR